MSDFPEHFERQYQLHLKHLKLKGLQPKTIDAYARGMRRIGKYFSYQVDALNAYAEALFRTAKYRPEFPAKGFAELDAARDWATDFVRW